MKVQCVCLIFLFFFSFCSVLQNNHFVYSISKSVPDTAHVYTLPFARGTSHPVWQGYHSLLSHGGNFAIDFKMKTGTGVHAAREGVVIIVKKENKRGGIGKRYVGKENRIVIRHLDGSYAHYLHLRYMGALVNIGDSVKAGQLIGYSGSTGFSAFPHLHFEVTRGPQKAKDEIPVRFYTEKGAIFLQPLCRYKAI